MQDAHGIVGKGRTDVFVAVKQVFQIQLFRFFDQGENHIDLPAFSQLFLHKPPYGQTVSFITVYCLNGLPSGRELVDLRNVKITEEGHGQRTGNGGGR
ncbi:hypothetical protein FQZ97_1186950 [compost metagenome]